MEDLKDLVSTISKTMPVLKVLVNSGNTSIRFSLEHTHKSEIDVYS